MNKKQIVDKAMDVFHIINRRNLVRKSNKKYFKMLRENNIPIKKLSDEQKRKVDEIYRKYRFKYSYLTHELVYSVTGKFYPEVVPEDMFRTEIEIYLNDFDSKYVLTDKNYFDVFMNDVRFPVTIVRNIEGVFYDRKYNVISEKEAEAIVAKYEKVVFKPSVENGVGKGVSLIETDKENPFKSGKKNYMIQEVLKQHKALSALNESSVNVCRIGTMFIGDKVHIVTAALRIGAVGAFTDNSILKDGKGMLVVGIDKNGKLREKGYHSCGVSSETTPGGVRFKGYEIPEFEKMTEIARKAHSMYPRLKFIAWDFTVDADGEIICMEYNARGPGVLYYQYANGPLFSNHAQEILEYAKKEKEKRKIFKNIVRR